jgi:hypothetical protein
MDEFNSPNLKRDMDYRKRGLVARKLDSARQQAFIAGYENLLNSLDDDEAVAFADAVHPTHEARQAGCCSGSGKSDRRDQIGDRTASATLSSASADWPLFARPASRTSASYHPEDEDRQRSSVRFLSKSHLD